MIPKMFWRILVALWFVPTLIGAQAIPVQTLIRQTVLLHPDIISAQSQRVSPMQQRLSKRYLSSP